MTTQQTVSTDKPKIKKRFKWTKRFLILGIVIGVLLASLPIAIKFVAVNWLHDNGAHEASIEDIDLNLFSGHFVIKNLVISKSTEQAFHLNNFSIKMAWRQLLEKKIVVEQIYLSGLELVAFQNEQKQLQIGALKIPSNNNTTNSEPVATDKATAWGFGLNKLSINDTTLRYRDDKINSELHIDELLFSNVASWLHDQPSNLMLKASIDEANILIDGQSSLFSPAATSEISIKLDKLNLRNYQALAQLGGVADLAGLLTTDLSLKVSLDKDTNINANIDGSIELQDQVAATDSANIQLGRLLWQGATKLTLNSKQNKQDVFTSGKLSANAVSVLLPGLTMAIKQESFVWEGEVDYKADAQQPSPKINMLASSQLHGLNVTNTAKSVLLLSQASMKFDGIAVRDDNTASVARISFEDTTIARGDSAKNQKSEQLAELGRLLVNQVELGDDNTLSIQSIHLKDLTTNITKQKNNNIKYLDAFQLGDSNKAQSDDDVQTNEVNEDAARKKMRIVIAYIEVAGNNTISFTDFSVEPTFKINLNNTFVKLKDIDSASLDNKSTLALDTNINQYSKLNLAGDLVLFADLLSAKLTGKLTSFDLAPLSSYTGKALGYNLKRGTLNSDIKINIDHGKLDVVNALKINKLSIGEQDKEKIDKLSQQLAMPVDAALDMLRDSDDNIEFTLTIEGDVNDPKVDPAGIMNLALGKALKAAAMNYLTNALQPLGTILLVGKLVDKATAPRFETLVFEAGSTVFAGNTQTYLDKIATLLIERPKLSITVCGVATNLDKSVVKEMLVQQNTEAVKSEEAASNVQQPEISAEAVREQLLGLATSRGTLVKSYFVETMNIKSERIFSCHPSVSEEKEAVPGVEISL